MNFQFLHAADLHLDTPFQGIARISPDLSDRLKDASLAALDNLVAEAIRNDVLFVVLAGDIYDGAERGIRAQLRVHVALDRLSEAGIHTFIVHGNHDPLREGWTAIRSWPERVHIFADDHVESKELHLDDGLVTVSGISYPSRDVTQNLALEFPRPARPGFHVAVLHANVGGSAEHPNYSPCSIEDLVQSGYDYWALGHIHGRQTLRVAKPVIAYPGNTQGRSFKPSEQGPKGASLVTVDDGVATTQFLDLGPIHFVELEVPATDLTDIGDLNEALMAAARSAQVPNRAVVLRGRVTGPTHLYDDLTRHDASDELLKILEDQTRHDAGVWWTNLHIDVRPERDFDAMARHDDLPGEVVRQGRAITGDMDELRFRLRDQTALGPWADQINDDELRAIADRATAIAASMVDKIRGE